MGIVRMGPPVELVIGLRDYFKANCFVETGTYMGGTATWASGQFERVVTIENSQEIYESTSGKLSHIGNIEFLFGHTTAILAEIVPELQTPVVFWLDAHWCGGKSYGKTDECPLLAELEIINRSKLPHSILIDDARLFTAPPPPPHDAGKWPDITSVLAAINSTSGRYTVIVDDTIISVPDSARSIVEEYCAITQRPPSALAMIESGVRTIAKGIRLLFRL